MIFMAGTTQFLGKISVGLFANVEKLEETHMLVVLLRWNSSALDRGKLTAVAGILF
jgi:hypothetical protein